MNNLYNFLTNLCDQNPLDKLSVFHKSIFAQGPYVGLASTVNCNQCKTSSDLGKLTTLPTKDIAKKLFSTNTLEAAIGLATINSYCNAPSLLQKGKTINAFDLIKMKGKNKNIALIGRFPRVDSFRKDPFYKNLWVFELEQHPDCLGPSDFNQYLPQADITLITATTLINHTFLEITTYLEKSFNILLGPSCPLHPILFDYKMDILAGSVVTDIDSAHLFLSQGASYRETSGIERVVLTKESYHA